MLKVINLQLIMTTKNKLHKRTKTKKQKLLPKIVHNQIQIKLRLISKRSLQKARIQIKGPNHKLIVVPLTHKHNRNNRISNKKNNLNNNREVPKLKNEIECLIKILMINMRFYCLCIISIFGIIEYF